MTKTERQLLITAKLYEEKMITLADYDEIQKKVFRYLMINELVTLPWNNPIAQMIKKQYHITASDINDFFEKFPSLEEDHGKPACDLEFDYEQGDDYVDEWELGDEPEVEPEEVDNILNDCAGCVFYNPDDDCCENNARICTYKEEE